MDWFLFEEINPIEKAAVPEFFTKKNKSKTPQVYRDYRDFMINSFRLSPTEYLTVTACRRNLAGDVCAVMRVHAVLESWGLINKDVILGKPQLIGPPSTEHFRISADTPRGVLPVFPTANEPRIITEVEITKMKRAEWSRRNIYRLEQESWNNNEDLILLETIEMNGANWDLVSAKTGRDKEMCIKRFLQVLLLVDIVANERFVCRYTPGRL